MSNTALRTETLEAFRAVLKPFLWNESVSEDTRILQDLGIDGDDADEFLEAVHKTFGTRFEGFNFSTYFSNQEIGNGDVWLRRLGFEDARKPLTVGHLVDVIIRGSWFDPPDQPVTFVKGCRLRRYIVRGLMAALFPIFFSGSALALGEGVGEAIGLARGVGLVVFGLPVAALLTVTMWRKLPAN